MLMLFQLLSIPLRAAGGGRGTPCVAGAGRWWGSPPSASSGGAHTARRGSTRRCSSDSSSRTASTSPRLSLWPESANPGRWRRSSRSPAPRRSPCRDLLTHLGRGTGGRRKQCVPMFKTTSHCDRFFNLFPGREILEFCVACSLIKRICQRRHHGSASGQRFPGLFMISLVYINQGIVGYSWHCRRQRGQSETHSETFHRLGSDWTFLRNAEMQPQFEQSAKSAAERGSEAFSLTKQDTD